MTEPTIEPYEGEPDDLPFAWQDETQDDLDDGEEPARGIMGRATTGQRDTDGTVEWYRSHETAAAIGFNPDGMCQKICRTARNIGPGAPSALASAMATPREHRVPNVVDIRRGMVVYYDNPDDSNPFGHVVTVVGRDPERDAHMLDSLLVRTNSVKTGQVVVVRGDYFGRFWSDPFQFAGTWLNGVALDLPDQTPKPRPPALPAGRVRRLEHWVDVLDGMIDTARAEGKTRLVRALRRDRKALRDTIERFGKRTP